MIDLDGTICSQEKSGTYQEAKPRIQIIKKINGLYAEGHDIIIFTARGMNTCEGDVEKVEVQYRTLTEKWLKENRVCYNELIFGKPAGDWYVDDKCMTPEQFYRHHDDSF